MIIKERIVENLEKVRIMQLATVANYKPWVCTVHYYSDDDLNIYWMSHPERRHSLEVAKNEHVSATIMVHEDNPDENYVIGVSVEGSAMPISVKDYESIARKYVAKLGKDANSIDEIISGKKPSQLYRLKPNKIVLFDNKNFPNEPRQEIDV